MLFYNISINLQKKYWNIFIINLPFLDLFYSEHLLFKLYLYFIINCVKYLFIDFIFFNLDFYLLIYQYYYYAFNSRIKDFLNFHYFYFIQVFNFFHLLLRLMVEFYSVYKYFYPHFFIYVQKISVIDWIPILMDYFNTNVPKYHFNYLITLYFYPFWILSYKANQNLVFYQLCQIYLINSYFIINLKSFGVYLYTFKGFISVKYFEHSILNQQNI